MHWHFCHRHGKALIPAERIHDTATHFVIATQVIWFWSEVVSPCLVTSTIRFRNELPSSWVRFGWSGDTDSRCVFWSNSRIFTTYRAHTYLNNKYSRIISFIFPTLMLTVDSITRTLIRLSSKVTFSARTMFTCLTALGWTWSRGRSETCSGSSEIFLE